MSAKETTGRTFLVAFLLCGVCSVLVSVSAVSLKSRQEENKQLDIRKNILTAAGLAESGEVLDGETIQARFAAVRTRVITYQSGETAESLGEDYDQYQAARKPETAVYLDRKEDIAGVKQITAHGKVYEVYEGEVLQTIILPVSGYGLWSTLYGFLAIDADGTTIKGITFYSHGETPGLGGEIENPRWRSTWRGKKLFDENGEMKFRVYKSGKYREGDQAGIDGISGATITSRGVDKLVSFWLSKRCYGKYLERIRNGW